MAPTRRVMWDLVETHLQELAFHAEQWERGLVSPLYDLPRLQAGPERWLLANLDAILVAGPQAQPLVLEPALLSDRSSDAFAAGLALLDLRGGEGLDIVAHELAAATGERRAALRRALALTRWPELEPELARAAHGDPRLLGPALEALAFRRHAIPLAWAREAASAPNAEVAAGALRAARRCGPAAFALVEQGLASAAPGVRDAAIATGLVLGAQRAWARCREVVERAEPEAALPLLALGLSGDPGDVARLVAALDHPPLLRAALFALGFTGRVSAADACVPHLDDPRAGPVAAEAIAAVSGLRIEGLLRAAPPPEPEEPRPFEEEDLDADLGPTPESSLPLPEPGAVADAWAAARERLDPDARHLAGAPFSGERLVAALASAPLRRRHGLALELAVRTHGGCDVETRGWAADQARCQAAFSLEPYRDVHLPFSKLLRV